MNVVYSKIFEKSARKLSGKYLASLAKAISEVKHAEDLSDITNCKKLTGFNNAYRIRVGDYRAFFVVTFVDDTVHFEYLLSRGDAYDKEYMNSLRLKDKEL